MSTTVFCKKFQKDLPAMTVPPMPGPKGKELMETDLKRHGNLGNHIKQLL
tara:strand:+ start:99 stop:248 length:150 start_codon:yes stop_codon:yes gene_type:complete